MCMCKYSATTICLWQALFALIDRCHLNRVDGQSLSVSARHTHRQTRNISQGDGLGLDKDNSAHSLWTHCILTLRPYMLLKKVHMQKSTCTHFYNSIHPSSALYKGTSCGGCRLCKVVSTSLHSNTSSSCSWAILKAFKGQVGCVIPPVCSASGSPPSWTCPKNIQREAYCRHLDQMPKPFRQFPS